MLQNIQFWGEQSQVMHTLYYMKCTVQQLEIYTKNYRSKLVVAN